MEVPLGWNFLLAKGKQRGETKHFQDDSQDLPVKDKKNDKKLRNYFPDFSEGSQDVCPMVVMMKKERNSVQCLLNSPEVAEQHLHPLFQLSSNVFD